MSLVFLAVVTVGAETVGAYPISPTPAPKATTAPTEPPPANVLPFDSTLLFVLDDPISSNHSKGGQMVRAHLRSDLVVGGRTVAAAGTPAQIKIVDASPSDMADTYGFVDIFFEPLVLPDGRSLPLRTPIARLTPNVSAGHASTVGAEDTVGDIFVPYYSIWQIVRKGKNFVLAAGSIVSARTEATLTAQRNGSTAIVTPRPLDASTEAPNSSYTAIPLATPYGPNGAMSHPRARPSPSPSPSPSPTHPRAHSARCFRPRLRERPDEKVR